MSPIRENDILFAHKALNLAEGLTDGARRVGAAIIDHFNRRTGQCDPSIDRLAKLLNMHRTTVMRATEQLHAAGLIECVKHGSRTHRNAYLPVWDKFNSLVAEWNAKMRGGASQIDPQTDDFEVVEMPPLDTKNQTATVAPVRPLQSHGCDFDSRTDATQTNRINYVKELREEAVSREREKKPDTDQSNSRSIGLLKGFKPTGPMQQSKVANSVSFGQMAENAANRRLELDLRGLGWEAYGDALERLTPEIAGEATAAEIKRRGDGLRLVCQRLCLPTVPGLGVLQ